MNADLIISGGQVIDGSAKSAFFADVAIDDGHIVGVGDLSEWNSNVTGRGAGQMRRTRVH